MAKMKIDIFCKMPLKDAIYLNKEYQFSFLLGQVPLKSPHQRSSQLVRTSAKPQFTFALMVYCFR